MLSLSSWLVSLLCVDSSRFGVPTRSYQHTTDIRSRRLRLDLWKPYAVTSWVLCARTERLCIVAPKMSLFQGFIQLGAGLSVGLAGLAAGFAIGIVGDAGVRGTAQQPRLFVGMVSVSARKRTRLLTPGCADSYPHFRRSFGSLRPHRCSHHEHQGRWCLSGMPSARLPDKFSVLILEQCD